MRRGGGGSPFNLYWQRADGTGDAERLTTNKNAQWPSSFHPNGRTLAFLETALTGPTDVMMLPIEGDEKSGWEAGCAVGISQGARTLKAAECSHLMAAGWPTSLA